MSGMFGASQFFFGDTGFYPYEINSSCRFNSASSEFVHRTPSSAGNRRTFTISFWTKKVGNSPSGAEYVISAHDNSTNDSSAYFGINFGTSDELAVVAFANVRVSTNKFRDNGGWYHVVLAVDSTQGSASNRMKLYVNGLQITDFSTNATVASNHDFGWNNTIQHRVGAFNLSANQSFYNGYVAEVHNVDGSQLTPESFGETKQGVWTPKFYTGSYGTNGFYLKFNQTGTGTASASTIGADSSGNGHHFTSSGLASIDANRTDSPTNNFGTWNKSWAGAGTYGTTGTLVNGGLELSSVGSETNAFCTQPLPSSGKYYVEMRVSSLNTFSGGVMQSAPTIHRSVLFQTDGTIDQDNSQVQSGLGSFSAGDTIGMLADMDAGTIQFKVENSNYGSAVTLSSLDTQGQYTFMCRANAYVEFRTDTKDMEFAIPDGYTTLSTANYPEPSISPLNGEKPADYFNTVLYTGNGGTQSITGVGFTPDWVWFKERSQSNDHAIFDVIRGIAKRLESNNTDAEVTMSPVNAITSFDSDGFSLGANANVNESSQTYVAWNWLAGNTTGGSNSDGSITSTIDINQEAGFSIIKYTGTGSNATIGHGLGKTPKWVIVKKLSEAGDWVVWSQGMGDGTKYMVFTSQVLLTASNIWNSTVPTSSVISIGTHATTNDASEAFICYAFAEIEGYSKFGRYTGNGESSDGTFVYTGFRPAYVLIKNIDDSHSWRLHDNRRPFDNLNGRIGSLSPDGAGPEGAIGLEIDILSNGFKPRTNNDSMNASETYIYMAFAEMPFKYANAR